MILRSNGIVLTHGGKPLDAADKRLLFLTYFDHYDDSTHIDTPVIGDAYEIPTDKQSYTSSTLNLFGGTISAVKNSYKSSPDYSLIYNKKIDASKTEVLSGEMWILPEGTRGDYGSHFGVAGSYIVCDPNYLPDTFAICGPYYEGNKFTAYNNTARSSYVSNYFKFGTNIRFHLSHFAYVIDTVKGERRFYIDGNIMLIIREGASKVPSNIGYYINQQSSGKTFTVTGIAIWNYDRSSADGMTYPVPTARYK